MSWLDWLTVVSLAIQVVALWSVADYVAQKIVTGVVTLASGYVLFNLGMAYVAGG